MMTRPRIVLVPSLTELEWLINVPLLFAKHEGCLGASEDGWEDALTAFSKARTVSAPEAPTVSTGFASALRSFCLEIPARTSKVAQRGGGSS